MIEGVCHDCVFMYQDPTLLITNLGVIQRTLISALKELVTGIEAVLPIQTLTDRRAASQ